MIVFTGASGGERRAIANGQWLKLGHEEAEAAAAVRLSPLVEAAAAESATGGDSGALGACALSLDMRFDSPSIKVQVANSQESVVVH